MRIKLNYIAPGLAAAVIGGAIALAPVASADSDPLVPYGTNPQVPYVLGFHESNHDEADTTNGQLDRAVLIRNVPKAAEYGGLPAQTPRRPLVVPGPVGGAPDRQHHLTFGAAQHRYPVAHATRRDGGPCGARIDDFRCICQVRAPRPQRDQGHSSASNPVPRVAAVGRFLPTSDQILPPELIL